MYEISILNPSVGHGFAIKTHLYMWLITFNMQEGNIAVLHKKCAIPCANEYGNWLSATEVWMSSKVPNYIYIRTVYLTRRLFYTDSPLKNLQIVHFFEL